MSLFRKLFFSFFLHFMLHITVILLVVVLLCHLGPFFLYDCIQPCCNWHYKLLAQVGVLEHLSPGGIDGTPQIFDVLWVLLLDITFQNCPHILDWPNICHFRCLQVIGYSFLEIPCYSLKSNFCTVNRCCVISAKWHSLLGRGLLQLVQLFYRVC